MGRQDRATPVRICDRTGRTRGAGFVADHLGTVVTSHETVGDLGHIVVRAPDGSGCEVTADAVTALPADALALVRTDGLGVRPLPIADRPAPPAGAYVHVHAHGWREARVLGTARAAHPTAEGLHPVGEALELAIGTDGREALEHGGAAGGPALDAATGAVLAVLAGSLRTDHRAAGLALPLARAAARVPGGPLAALLRRNAVTVPAHGADLNLAGALRLARLTHPAVHPARTVARPAVARLLDLFAAPAPAPGRPLVCGLVGEPGSGRTTALAALAHRRAAATAPEPVLWLRGADLRRGDTSLGDAVGRALDRADRAAAAAGETRGVRPQARAEAPDAPARHAARVAGDAGRPLLVLLDGPEEAPPSFAEGLPGWTSRTVDWLRRHGVRLALACGPAYWEAAGALYPPDVLYGDGAPAGGIPSAVRVGDLTRGEAEEARVRYGLPAGALAPADARHPLALRLLADVRAAFPGAVPARAERADVFAAHLELLCLRAAHRVAAGHRPARPGARVRELAAEAAGRAHEAARRCLGPGHGELDRASFEELFPRDAGWAPAVLTEGLLVAAGAGYRFADEGFAEWLQAVHLDVDAALESLVHARGPEVPAPDRLPCTPPGRGAAPPPAAAAPAPALPAGRPAPAALPAGRPEGRAAPSGGSTAPSYGSAPGWEVPPGEAARYASPPGRSARPGGSASSGEAVPSGGFTSPGGSAPPDRRAPSGGDGPTGIAVPGRSFPSGRAVPSAHPAPDGRAGCGRGPGAAASTGHAVAAGRAERPAASAHPVPPGAVAAAGRPVPPPYGLPAAGRTPDRDAARGRFAPFGQVPGPVPPSGGGPEGFAPSGPAPGAGTPPGHPLPPGTAEPRSAEVPPYRAGVVVRALLLVERYRGAGELAPRLERLVHRGGGPADADRWADRLLRGTLQGVRDARPYAGVLRLLAARLAARPAAGDRDAYGAPFWERLRLGEDERLDLLRRVLPADAPGRPGCLEAVARRLAADPRGVQPLLCRWFTDDRPLPAGPGSPTRTTVADAARALLHAHRGLAADDLCEALVTTAHPHADGLLAVLVRDEPAALCRAVDRWAHDDARPARRVAAAAYGPLLAARVTADADREALRYAALALLARPGDHSLHGAALAVLVHDPHSRARHLRQALAVFRAGDRGLPARALTAALTTHPEPVLAAFRTRLHVGGPAAAADVLDALADVRTPALARRAAALVRGYVDGHPGGAVHAAAHVDRRLEQGPAARAVLLPLVTDLLRGRPAEVRAALVPVLAAPGTPVSRALRGELLDALLDLERDERPDPAVPEALLEAAARGAAARPEPRTRDLVLRSAELLARTPKGAARLDRRLAELAGEVPGFAALLTGRSAEAPYRRAAPAGPAAPRAVGGPAERGPRGQDPPVTGGYRPPCRCGADSAGMAPLDLRIGHDALTHTGSGEERSQCSAGEAWRRSPRTGGAASSPSVPTTASTAGTS